MGSQESRNEMLRHALEFTAPGEWAYEGPEQVLTPTAVALEARYIRKSIRPYGELHLEVALRGDGDIDVRFHIPGHRPEWVEAHFILPEAVEQEAFADVARFVEDFLAERLVVGFDSSLFTGGRVFVPVSDVGSARSTKLAWIVSWLGTHDRSQA